MNTLRLCAGVLLMLLLAATAAPATLHAQDVRTDACFAGVFQLMAREERVYRSVLYGQKPSARLTPGSVRYDTVFNAWMKTEENQWRSLAQGFEGTTWSDALMEDHADVPARRGIFETKAATTSDLLPPLLQSVRALQCRLRAVCELERMSQNGTLDPATSVTVRTDGCMPMSFLPLPGCADTKIANMSVGTCDASVRAIVEREAHLLHLAVAYDAAYRSLLQFAGSLEGFLLDFRFPLLAPIWQAVRSLGSLDRLPCFSAQCDE